MPAYYSVKIRVRTENEKGVIKTHVEPILVAAETPEDAAYKAREYYGQTMTDYTIDSTSITKYLAVID